MKFSYFLCWIPVRDGLPEENRTVMASTKYAVYPEARYTKDGWEWAYESGADYWVDLEDVIAWMPLPKPYTESEVRDADKKYEAKIVNRGNCMLCGKELSEGEGIFFCKECEEKSKK